MTADNEAHPDDEAMPEVDWDIRLEGREWHPGEARAR